jgi:hypothetical protein
MSFPRESNILVDCKYLKTKHNRNILILAGYELRSGGCYIMINFAIFTSHLVLLICKSR